MSKKLDLNKTVFELVQEYPELVEILKNLGFTEITKKAMLHSVGRMMTIPKGAKTKGISMMEIVPVLMQNGFELVGDMPNISLDGHTSIGANDTTAEQTTEESSVNTTEQLKGYLRRLGEGEDLESVRADFVAHFTEVDPAEIMQAEQELIQEGTPITEVQKLCDVHSALFHGTTREEKIANAEKAVEASMQQKKDQTQSSVRKQSTSEPQSASQPSSPMPATFTQKYEETNKLRDIMGHPIAALIAENVEIQKQIDVLKDISEQIEQGEQNVQDGCLTAELTKIRQLSVHYAKKGDLLYPHLKVKYGISGPSDVMWTVDDEIRDELAELANSETRDAEWIKRLQAVLVRAEEMIYKEENILFPNCAVNFSKEEWMQIYEDAKDYDMIFGVEQIWDEAETLHQTKSSFTGDEIVMAGGSMTLEQLTAMLNTLPIEISFIDADNINRYYNEGPKVFKRPQMSLGREVFSCHPPKIEPMVRAILDEFRNGSRDSVPVWMEKGGKPFLVTYMAVRDKQKNYLGTVEVVQDMSAAKEHFEK